ncbi:TolB amino-terminal domain-containing protein [Draconibacterium orientale]|uniref:AraC family transcriptional regulator n=1 Tax=Draconibacterium orientale TaxID=1168034 RepID=X5DDF6_9BACT|nr:helix-turn-helix domain-containing protein [Draconibacterium orientale]AHW60883.1 AraC family transcriptional regulator [Draconibacterium orientale]SES65360.1 TolB amino-terminal domain-containing protein [Draconibacterium orientale]
MSNTSILGADFIEQVEAIILENIANEQFGVSELADLMNMSRSSLLRKIKTHTQLSASQFIRQVRVTKGMEMLKQTSLTVAEISYEVGFGNTSYFIKCFREQYGYSPGEVRKGAVPEENGNAQESVPENYKWYAIGAMAVVVIVGFVLFFSRKSESRVELEKSIAVLPFVNESSDSLNLYFVNGLMESTLNNLQKIGDLRVVSRTSVARYRGTEKSIPEIAEELNVNYLVEGSGQRFGNQVLLNIQLVEAATDRPIWGEQYSREVDDVFALQNEVARKIAQAIKAVVTPAELQQIEKIPTENLEAYDYYLQALNLYYNRTPENLEKAISLFEKAIEEDDQFALAYANVAISYYFLDVNQKEKQYTEQINNFADKALLYDSRSAESLIAKALYYMQIEEYNLALPHLEKALEYNPNSLAVVQMLADLYARVIPNTAKYLEYALKGIQLDVAANDSIGKSYIYLALSNALVQNGFVDEAATYIEKSLDFNPENYYAPLMKAYILYAQDGDGERTKRLLLQEWRKDTTRLDLLQEVAKVYYYQEDYDSAFYYFEKFVAARDKGGLDIYPQEDVKIARVYEKMGLKEQAANFFDNYVEYCEKDQSIYKSASMAVMYAYKGEYEKAVEQLKIFSTQDNYQYWILLFQDMDPILKPLEANPEYRKTIQKINDRFWKKHATIEKVLAEKGLL